MKLQNIIAGLMATDMQSGFAGSGSRKRSDHRTRAGRREYLEALESRMLLSATVGALEVWAGDTPLTDGYNVDTSGYVKLGVTNLSNGSTHFTDGNTYQYYVLAARAKLQIDAVRGSDDSYLSSQPDSDGSNVSSLVGSPVSLAWVCEIWGNGWGYGGIFFGGGGKWRWGRGLGNYGRR